MFRTRAHRLLAAVLLLTALIAVIAGCGGNSSEPVAPAPDPLASMPARSSPSSTTRALEWALTQRSIAGYRLLFTSDYVFTFASLDDGATVWDSSHPWGRTEEEGSFTTLVQGGDATQSAATRIDVMFDKNLTVLNDPRPGKEDPVRRHSITTQVNLNITTADGASTNIFGSITLYLVRGDIAAIPSELGAGPDSTKWYIEGWRDGTNGSASLVEAPQPTKSKTWGSFKELYLPASLRP